MITVHAESPQPAIDHLVETLTTHLQAGEHILWLLSGGSGAKVCLEVAKRLQDQPLENLWVTLTDERYGDVGHADENWQQLLDAGFSLPGATLYRPLNGLDRPQTTAGLASWLKEHIESADYSVGLFGIGPDGHTAGIKPQSPAASSTEWAADFTGEDFERITMTFPAIRDLSEVVTQAMGAEKGPTLRQLLQTDTDLAMQPAQVLKTVKKSTLYTDYKEDET
jgi:6-phosphogluconolactonase/glucosamine-6-phosphate isomerase/deaminase